MEMEGCQDGFSRIGDAASEALRESSDGSGIDGITERGGSSSANAPKSTRGVCMTVARSLIL